jgi:hypothetical protein
VKPCKALRQLAAASGQFFLFKLVDQIDYIEEATPFAIFDCLTGYSYCQMRLAGAGAANT